MTKEQMKGEVRAMKDYFDRSTRVLEEADSTFAPAEGMFTAAQQVAHAAQTIDWFFAGVYSPSGFDLDFARLDHEVRAVTSLAAARRWMERALGAALGAIDAHSESEWAAPLPAGPIMGGLPRYSVFSGLTDHTAHHRD